MTLMGIQRRSATAGVRSTLLFAIVAMLNLAVQPCAMAMELDTEHPCPHCPDSGAGHHVAEPSSVADTADCNSADVYNLDARTSETGTKNPAQKAAVCPIEIFSLPAPDFRADRHEVCARPVAPPGGPPLNVLHCVYLK